MLSLPDDQPTQPQRQLDQVTTNPTMPAQLVFPSQVQNTKVTRPLSSITRQLAHPYQDTTTGQHQIHTGKITRQLPAYGIHTTNQLPIVIPAPRKQAEASTGKAAPRQRRLNGLIVGLMLCIVILVFIPLFVIPLGDGESQQSIIQTISNILTTGAANALNPLAHPIIATPTPVVLTKNGSCAGHTLWDTCAKEETESGVMGTGHMQRPMKGAIITQPFANPEYQSWCGCVKPHSGIDLAAPYGTPVMAADSGQVIWVGWDWSGLGWAVKISHGHSIATVYGHLARYVVSVGQTVKKGDVIAYEGSTGASTGPHVHFMVLVNNIWVNPANYIALP